jgi:hypothetical protein
MYQNAYKLLLISHVLTTDQESRGIQIFSTNVLIYVSIEVLLNDLTKTPWPESASELYRPSDRSLSVKLVPTFADRGCLVVSVTDSNCRILRFLDRSR